MRFIRGERETTGITVVDGEAGRGVYFCSSSNRDLVNRFLTGAKRVQVAKLKSGGRIVDLTHPYYMLKFLEFAEDELDLMAERSGPKFIRPRITAKSIHRYGKIIVEFLRCQEIKADAIIVP